ncbi:MAG: Ig-like domain-containing protein, partial [Planctomycetota bacterium]
GPRDSEAARGEPAQELLEQAAIEEVAAVDVSRSVVEGDAGAESGPAPAAPDAAADLNVLVNEAAAEPGEADLSATQTLEVRVVDRLGAPVMDARVWIMGHRSEAERGSYYSYRGDEPEGRTDFDGRVDLEHFVWLNQDGRVSEVDLHVQHPDFIQYRNANTPVEPGLHTVTLEQGATVAVTAWIGSPDRVLTDVELRTGYASKVGPDDWVLEGERWTSTRFPAGPHSLRLSHTSDEHGRCYSEQIEFTVEAGAFEDLFVELVPAIRLEGRLDPQVPRPIVDGVALISIHSLAEGSGGLSEQRQVKIDANGDFVFEELPPGEGQILALCQGWWSTRGVLTRPWTARANPTDENGNELSFEELSWSQKSALQALIVPSEEPLVVAMEPTGTLAVTVVDEAGQPIPDAAVAVSPNYYMLGIGSSIVPGRQWSSRTGPDGVALIEDLPAEDSLFVHSGHRAYQMRQGERIQTPTVDILSGERTEYELVLERKP